LGINELTKIITKAAAFFQTCTAERKTDLLGLYQSVTETSWQHRAGDRCSWSITLPNYTVRAKSPTNGVSNILTNSRGYGPVRFSS